MDKNFNNDIGHGTSARPAQAGQAPVQGTSARPAQAGQAPVQGTSARPAQAGQTPVQGTSARPAQARPIPPQSMQNAPTQNISLPSIPASDAGEMTREMPEGGVSQGGQVNSGDGTVELSLDNGRKKEKKKKIKKESEYTEANNTVMGLVKCMVYVTAVLMVSSLISVAVIFAANDIFAFVKSDKVMEIEIPEGSDFDDIADILHDNNIINYKLLFKMYMGGKVKDVKFASGTYSLSPMTSYSDLIYTLREKPPSGISLITIPEGYTVDEIIDLMVSKGIGTREKYVDVINNYDFDYWFIDELGESWADSGKIYRLEGYLFPDSYQFYNASSEVTVINKLLARFDDVFTKTYREAAEKMGYTVDQIMTLASMIEKEGGDQADFGYVSSVFHNRLKSPAYFPNLESDATIAYVIHHETGKRPVLTGEDLRRDTPYNTYMYGGLCPGPIANPSYSAINAALNPTASSYYFFISDGAKTYFNETKAGHDAKRAEILAGRQGN